MRAIQRDLQLAAAVEALNDQNWQGLDNLKIITARKTQEEIKRMIAGAKSVGLRQAVQFLTAALLLRAVQDAERRWQLKEEFGKDAMGKGVCLHCGKDFRWRVTGKGPPRKTCSQACRTAYSRERQQYLQQEHLQEIT